MPSSINNGDKMPLSEMIPLLSKFVKMTVDVGEPPYEVAEGWFSLIIHEEELMVLIESDKAFSLKYVVRVEEIQRPKLGDNCAESGPYPLAFVICDEIIYQPDDERLKPFL